LSGTPEIWTLDIETRPNEGYFWGMYNQNISPNQIKRAMGVLCFAAKRYGSDNVEFHADWQKKGHAGMIQRLHEIYNLADGVITYNGANYDTKWIKGEFVKAELPPPSPFKDIDLYRVVRKHFNFAFKKLGWVCTELGMEGKADSGGMETWIECIYPSSRDAGRKARADMKNYNCIDTVRTEQLYERLRGWIDSHPNMALYAEDGQERCARCGSDDIHWRGVYRAATYSYPRFQCQKCGGWGRGSRSFYSSELRSA
jgi:RNase_H superfamily